MVYVTIEKRFNEIVHKLVGKEIKLFFMGNSPKKFKLFCTQRKQ